MAKTFKIDLFDSRSIYKAVNSLRDYEEEFLEACNKAIMELVDVGVDTAQVRIVMHDAFYTGNLVDSINGIFNANTRVGVIWSDAYYAAFVEYGTGIVGERAPHPGAESDMWTYDVNGHGDEGWWYLNNGWHFTTGMAARPFLYETRLMLEQQAPDIYERLVGQI